MSMDLQGKIALVTGAGAGIGQSIALELARAGATVAINYRQNEAGARQTLALIEQAGGQGQIYQADVARANEVQALLDAVVARYGRLDILVNNAGGLVQRSKISEMSEDLWNEVIDINTKSTFLCCRAVIPVLSAQGGGHIVNMASLAAHDGGGPGATAYAASKGAILSFTRGLAKELAPLGIRVNCVAPGLINTAFHDTFSTPQARQNTVNNTPLAREGQPPDVAGAVLFLVSDLAAFITGEVININGGLRMS
jgi:3-oxoacyl-[acyl-carrier protein] reductase